MDRPGISVHRDQRSRGRRAAGIPLKVRGNAAGRLIQGDDTDLVAFIHPIVVPAC